MKMAVETVTSTHVYFYGGVFSNFYPCEFELEGKTWVTSEQYFMWKKALLFGDADTAAYIASEKDPLACKMAGRGIRSYNDEKWAEVRYKIMRDAVYNKFVQDPYLRNYILKDEFEDLIFVEASPTDTVWGVGLDQFDERIKDESNWRGTNLLGEVIMEVRDTISSYYEKDA